MAGCSRGQACNNVDRKEGHTWGYINRRGQPNRPRQLAECNWGASSEVLGELSGKWHPGHWLLCWSKHQIPRREVPISSSCLFLNDAGARPITVLSCCGGTKGRKTVTAKAYSLGSCQWWSDRPVFRFIWPCLPCLCGKFLPYSKSSLLHGFKICSSGYHKFFAIFEILWSTIILCHECPARAITGLVKEAFRVLRPGGTIALTDNSPK